MNVPWDAIGVAFLAMGAAGFLLIPWLCRRVERQRLDCEVAAVLEDWDADVELLVLLAEESGDSLFLLAEVVDGGRGDLVPGGAW